ncbi:MAG: hypothetical protein F6J93_18280 [Oscillatoria sp. SIO1A7]|nr:hypothetical protein [Oscillatoria sp. SIO1A7]
METKENTKTKALEAEMKTETNFETERTSLERYKVEKQYRFFVGITLLVVSCLILLVLVTVSMAVTLQQTLVAIAGLAFISALDAFRRCMEEPATNSSSTIWGNTYHVYNNSYRYRDVFNTYNEKQDLKEAAIKIDELLDHLSETYPTTTKAQKIVLATEAVEKIENDPEYEEVISVISAGGVEALKQLLNHPAASFVLGFVDEWQKTRSSSER